MKKVLAIWCLAILGLHSTCHAGILDGHAAAYNGIAGSVPFTNGAGLSGAVDYAIFTAADFNANFGGLGYVPSGGLVYAYQVVNTASQAIDAVSVHLSNPANSIGTFDIGDVDAASASLTSDAEWTFAPGIGTGDSSWGIAFSSFRTPIVGFATVAGGAESWFFGGVPVPGTNAIPEPGSATTLALGATLLFAFRRVCGRS